MARESSRLSEVRRPREPGRKAYVVDSWRVYMPKRPNGPRIIFQHSVQADTVGHQHTPPRPVTFRRYVHSRIKVQGKKQHSERNRHQQDFDQELTLSKVISGAAVNPFQPRRIEDDDPFLQEVLHECMYFLPISIRACRSWLQVDD